MNRTPIEWVKNVDGTPGYTCNPMTGCLNCIDGRCGGAFPCYAYLQSKGRCHQQDLKGESILEGGGGSFSPRIHSDRFQHLFNATRGAGIFVCDRSDWAAAYWPEWCQTMILEAAQQRPDIRLYLLTKQPQELSKWSPFPDNVWVGVSAIDNEMFAAAYIHLTDVEAKVKFISAEPLLCWDKRPGVTAALLNQARQAGVNGLIIGAQTKPYKPPDIERVKEIIESADAAGIPVFLKDNLRWPRITADGSAPFYKKEKDTWVLRQEMPVVKSVSGVTPIGRT